MDDLDHLIREFLVESHENLDQLDRDLVQLETDPHNRERLDRIFRTIHTIKGTCGFLNFDRLEAVTHAGESLLSHLRDGRLVCLGCRERPASHLPMNVVVRTSAETACPGQGSCAYPLQTRAVRFSSAC